MSSSGYQSSRKTKPNDSKEPNVSSGGSLPPITEITPSTHRSFEYQSTSQQTYPQNIYHQTHRTPQDSSQPRFTPLFNSPARSMSSSSSSSSPPVGPGRMPSIQNILNVESNSSDRSAASSLVGSAIASPAQGYDNMGLTMANMELDGSDSGRRRNSEHSSSRNTQRTPMLQPLNTTTNRSSDFDTINPASESILSLRDRARMKLVILQQPQSARACGHGERDRRVIDPPPILQLQLEDYDPHSESDKNLLRSHFYVVHCHLIAATDDRSQRGQDVSMISDPSSPSQEVRKLMGQLTSSPFVTKELDCESSSSIPEDAKFGNYYIFSDLSCRQNGRYRLKFTLTPMDAASMSVGGRADTACVTESDEFTVYSAKEFPGMLSSSSLTKRLKDLGASIPIKKGNEGRRAVNRRGAGDTVDGSGNESN